MALSNISGFPRIGPARELKFATEGAWKGEVSGDDLLATAKQIRVDNWRFMQQQGIDLIPSNDFSLYDQVLDAIALVGAVPERYGHDGGTVDLDTYFAMARGRQEGGVDVTAMEMTKWFDTNYHYIVPELGPDTSFSLSSEKPFAEHAEAMEELGIDTVPVLVGPVSFLLLGKSADGVPEDFDRLTLLEDLIEVYGEVLERLAEQGASWVQLDEPCFVMDRSEHELGALRLAYEELSKVKERTRILVKTYFDHAGDAYGVLRDLPVEGVGLDFHRHHLVLQRRFRDIDQSVKPSARSTSKRGASARPATITRAAPASRANSAIAWPMVPGPSTSTVSPSPTSPVSTASAPTPSGSAAPPARRPHCPAPRRSSGRDPDHRAKPPSRVRPMPSRRVQLRASSARQFGQ